MEECENCAGLELEIEALEEKIKKYEDVLYDIQNDANEVLKD